MIMFIIFLYNLIILKTLLLIKKNKSYSIKSILISKNKYNNKII